MQVGRRLHWGDLSVGMCVRAPFSVDEQRMREFAELSGDNSRIHRDAEFARSNGFGDRVVYGALQMAQLSYVIGMLVPGDLGLATGWQINFRSPLYIGDEADFRAEVTHLSEATRMVTLKFTVSVGARVVATGTAQSKLLEDDSVQSASVGTHE